MGELTKELMRRSQVAQAHSTTYHPQTNGSVEKQIGTLVSMLRVYCSRYITDWDRYLPQVMGAYNITQNFTTGVSPHMMLTGHVKSLPLNQARGRIRRRPTAILRTILDESAGLGVAE